MSDDMKATAHDEIERLQARIEELEVHVAETEYYFEHRIPEEFDFKVITDEQIDAAWGWVTDQELGGRSRNTAKLVLKELGIKRCEGCGGEGITRQYPGGEPLEPCPDCNGHGWVIGGDE